VGWLGLTSSFQTRYGPGVNSVSNRNNYQVRHLGGKGGRCLMLITLSPSCADCQLSAGLSACPGLYRYCENSLRWWTYFEYELACTTLLFVFSRKFMWMELHQFFIKLFSSLMSSLLLGYFVPDIRKTHLMPFRMDEVWKDKRCKI
jgi:hypothetical protein